MKKSIRVQVWSCTTDRIVEGLKDFIDRLRSELVSIPQQYRHNATISVDANDLTNVCVKTYYYRPETNEEYKKRTEKEARETRRKQNAEALNVTYEQYLELKKLFKDN